MTIFDNREELLAYSVDVNVLSCAFGNLFLKLVNMNPFGKLTK